jgi:hypothetical protein
MGTVPDGDGTRPVLPPSYTEPGSGASAERHRRTAHIAPVRRDAGTLAWDTQVPYALSFPERRHGEVRLQSPKLRSREPRTSSEETRREGGPLKRGKKERGPPQRCDTYNLELPTEHRLCQVTMISYTRWPFLNRPSEPPPVEYMEPTRGRETLAREGANG